MIKRLDAILSSAGKSRKEARELIQSGKVSVNGLTVKKSDTKISENDTVSVNGVTIETDEFIYLLLYKPAGYVSTTENTEDSVMELIPDDLRRKGLAPAGRLDKDSEGLLILSNDGEYIHRIISPKSDTKKEYYIETKKSITEDDIKAFADGILLADGEKCLPAVLTSTSPLFNTGNHAAKVIINEGKYHQVKRMIASRNNKVTRLIRMKIGEFSIDGMTEREIKRFFPDIHKQNNI